jgi:small subunit ribosomal protein S15
MSITKEFKKEIISKFLLKKNDTGSVEVQVALFTEHITNLTKHLKINKKDYQGRRGLLMFVTKRKRLLTYLKDNNIDRYGKIIKKLKLKSI